MTLKLGMLGMWHTHADGMVHRIAEHPDEFQLIGGWDADSQVVAARRQRWKALLPSFRVFDTAEALLNSDIDGVVVEGRVFENLKLARLGLESGRPVLLEKPAGDKLHEFTQLIKLAQRKHLHVQMIYLFRYMSAVQEMFRLVKSGQLGQIYAFRARLPKDLETYEHFVEELRPYKGGMFFEMGGHVIDMMVAVLGKPQKLTGFLAHHFDHPAASYRDNSVAVFEYSRAFGIIEVPALEVVPRLRRIEVFGTEGGCVIPHLGSGHLANKNVQSMEVFHRGQQDWRTLELPAATLQIADLREFAAVVAQKKEPEFNFEHDLIVQQALLEACGMA